MASGLHLSSVHRRGRPARSNPPSKGTGPPMVLLRARLRVALAHRDKVIRSLSMMMGPLRASVGCVSCNLYTDVEDDNVLLFTQEWIDQESLADQLGVENARVLLSALDWATDRPEVRLDTLIKAAGLEFIARCVDVEWPET